MLKRITMNSIMDRIEKVSYLVIPETTVTLCMITMINGFSVRGESACVDPAAFNKALGEKFSYEDAFDQLWKLEGYLLKEKMYQENDAKEKLAPK